MAVGANISKTNLAVASAPEPGPLISKTNLAVASAPEPGPLISKTNLAVASMPFYLLIAGSSTYALTGLDVSMMRRGPPLGPHRQIAAPMGGLPIGSFPTVLTAGRVLALDPGDYAAAGTAAGTKAGRLVQGWRNLLAGMRVDRGFLSDTSAWIVDGADTTFTAANGRARLTLGPAAHGGFAYQQINLTPGRSYTLQTFLRSNATSNAGMRLGTSIGGAQFGASSVGGSGAGAPSIGFIAPPDGVLYVQLWSSADHDCYVEFDWAVIEDTAFYPVTGAAAAITKTGRLMPASAGLFELTGSSATLTVSRKAGLQPGSYTRAGTAAQLRVGRVVAPDAGSYLLGSVGADLNYIIGVYTRPDGGAYALGGSDARLVVGRKLPLGSSSYTLSGSDAAWVYRRAIKAAPGTYALGGAALPFLRGYAVKAAVGSYVLTGTDINLVSRRLALVSGTYAVSGVLAQLRADRRLTGDPATYVAAGAAGSPLYGRRLVADSESYGVIGGDAAVLASRILAASGGAYALTGLPAITRRGYIVVATSSSYVLGGSDVSVSGARVMLLDGGGYSTSWQAVDAYPTWRARGPRAIAVGIAATRYASVPPQNRRAAVGSQSRRCSVEAAPRRYAAVQPRDKELQGGSMLKWPEKDPNEVLDYELDWANPEEPRLETGETLLTSVWSVVVGDVEIDQVATDFTPQGLSTVWLSGGTAGVKCELLNRVTTSKGRTYDKSVLLRVRDH